MVYFILMVFVVFIQMAAFNYAKKLLQNHERLYVESHARGFSSLWSLIGFIVLLIILSLFSGTWLSFPPFKEIYGFLNGIIIQPREMPHLKGVYGIIRVLLTGVVPCWVYMYINAYLTNLIVEKYVWKK